MENKKVIHHIELSHTSPNLSGGEKAMIEIVKYLSQFQGISQIIYTSESGKLLYSSLLGEEKKKIKFVVIGKKWLEDINHYLAYGLRSFQTLFYLKRFKGNRNIIFSHDEFLPTSIYSYLLKLINPVSKWVIFFHMKAPSLFRGFEGEYTGKFKFPSLKLVRYKLEQILFFVLTRNKINQVLTVNPCYFDYLNKIYPKNKIYVIKKYAGVNVKTNKSYKKKFDLVFMGRFHEQKGLFEIIEIMELLKEKKIDVSLAMIGGGNPSLKKEFFKMARERGLSNSISYFGYISDDSKFDILQSSKIMLFPSYYESFGQVALEAMKCGLPVVAYDLPPFVVFEKGMIKVPVLDNEKMVEKIIKLLENYKYYKKTSKIALEYSSTFSWERTGEEVSEVLGGLMWANIITTRENSKF